jgi:thioredoxin reductase (NADPH)
MDLEQVFPTLTPAQCERLSRHGSTRVVAAGDVLVEPGQDQAKFLLILRGTLEILRLKGVEVAETITLRERQFTGEVNTLAGRRSLVRIRAAEPGEVVEVERDRVLTVIQGDSELSEILMRAFLLRRVEIAARGSSDVVLVGSHHCSSTCASRSS